MKEEEWINRHSEKLNTNENEETHSKNTSKYFEIKLPKFIHHYFTQQITYDFFLRNMYPLCEQRCLTISVQRALIPSR